MSVKHINRQNTNCVKWDGMGDKFSNKNLLPLWIADMDFEVMKEVKTAINNFVNKSNLRYYRIL